MENPPKFDRPMKPQGIMPCTIGMLNRIVRGESENFNYGGQGVDMVEVVARVIEFKETALRYEFKLQDHTGTFSAMLYSGTKAEQIMQKYVYEPQGYVHIVGNIRKFADASSIVIINMENIKSAVKLDMLRAKVLWAHSKLNSSKKTEAKNLEKDIVESIRRINAVNDPSGIHIDNIMIGINNTADKRDVEAALQEMLINGELIQGSDWDHYCLP